MTEKRKLLKNQTGNLPCENGNIKYEPGMTVDDSLNF